MSNEYCLIDFLQNSEYCLSQWELIYPKFLIIQLNRRVCYKKPDHQKISKKYTKLSEKFIRDI